MIDSRWEKEHDKIWQALSRIRQLYKPSFHDRAQIIYDCLNKGSLLKPNEEALVIAHIVDELMEIEKAPNPTIGMSGHLVERLRSIDAI